eukprot:scaffold17728_cov62-Phaeocystis_antarctica.AAC.7
MHSQSMRTSSTPTLAAAAGGGAPSTLCVDESASVPSGSFVRCRLVTSCRTIHDGVVFVAHVRAGLGLGRDTVRGARAYLIRHR